MQYLPSIQCFFQYIIAYIDYFLSRWKSFLSPNMQFGKRMQFMHTVYKFKNFFEHFANPCSLSIVCWRRGFHGVASGLPHVHRLRPSFGSARRCHLRLQVHHRLPYRFPHTQRDSLSRKSSYILHL